MTRKITFGEWEETMTQKIMDVREATEKIYGVIFSTPLRQTAKEKLVAIEGLAALESQLTGELKRARRKHLKRQNTMCQSCGEQRASWRTWDGQYLCTDCACSRRDIRKSVQRCECCGRALYGVTGGGAGDLYCSITCALKAKGCEPMTEDEL